MAIPLGWARCFVIHPCSGKSTAAQIYVAIGAKIQLSPLIYTRGLVCALYFKPRGARAIHPDFLTVCVIQEREIFFYNFLVANTSLCRKKIWSEEVFELWSSLWKAIEPQFWATLVFFLTLKIFSAAIFAFDTGKSFLFLINQSLSRISSFYESLMVTFIFNQCKPIINPLVEKK